MPAVRQSRFAKPELLMKMKPASITTLFHPHLDYLRSRNIHLPEPIDASFDFTEFALVLATPTEFTPPALIEHLELLDLISETQSILNFEEEYHQVVQKYREPDDSPADLAVKILVHAPQIAWREFDRQALKSQRSMVSYHSDASFPFLEVTDDRIVSLQNILAPWFQENARTGYCRVHSRKDANGVAFVIRHGDLLTRLGVIGENGTQLQLLRPERLDIVHYRSMTREWQISGVGSRIQEAYRKGFGRVFHGSTNALSYSERYSLEPLRDGPTSLECDRTSIVQDAVLKKLRLAIASGQQITLEHGNIFDALNHLSVDLMQTSTLIEATLNLKIAHRRNLAHIKICPARDSITGIAGLPAVEEWLTTHHFTNDQHAAVLLESA